jgi:hypothetical protein
LILVKVDVLKLLAGVIELKIVAELVVVELVEA